MGDSVQLGRIAGVRIGLNWSWAVVFALIVWTLPSSVFPDHNPGLSDGSYLAMAVAAARLFLVWATRPRRASQPPTVTLIQNQSTPW